MSAPICVPGTFLGKEEDKKSGSGTFCIDGNVFSSMVGTAVENEDTFLVSGETVHVPINGSVVICRVLKITRTIAHTALLYVDDQRLTTPFKGMIKHTDVRSYDVDKVAIPEHYRPGDILRATVLSLGDGRSVILSTAGEGMGLVYTRRNVPGKVGEAKEAVEDTDM